MPCWQRCCPSTPLIKPWTPWVQTTLRTQTAVWCVASPTTQIPPGRAVAVRRSLTHSWQRTLSATSGWKTGVTPPAKLLWPASLPTWTTSRTHPSRRQPYSRSSRWVPEYSCSLQRRPLPAAPAVHRSAPRCRRHRQRQRRLALLLRGARAALWPQCGGVAFPVCAAVRLP